MPEIASRAFAPETDLARSLGDSLRHWNGVYTPFLSNGSRVVRVEDIVDAKTEGFFEPDGDGIKVKTAIADDARNSMFELSDGGICLKGSF